MNTTQRTPNGVEPKTVLEQFTVVKRAIVYSRVSTDEQAESGTSLDNQDEKSLAHVAGKGMRLVAEPFREDFTGTTLDRPELNKVLAMLRSGQADALIVYNNTRLDRSKNGVNLLLLFQQLEKLGVELHYSESSRKVNLSNPHEMLLEIIGGWQSGEERRVIVKRLRDGRASRARQGGVMVFSRPPYGYRLVKNDKIFALELDEDEARVIRLIFHLYTVGERGIPLSLGAICDRLDAMGASTPANSGERVVTAKRKRSKWIRSTIHRILHNETYLGQWAYNKTEWMNGKQVQTDKSQHIPVSVPVIIDPGTWAIAQKRLAQNQKYSGRKNNTKTLMSRRLRCQCGYRIYTIAIDEKRIYYRCPGKTDRDKIYCSLSHFPASKVDAMIWQWVKGFFENEEHLEQGIADHQARQKQLVAPLLEELATIDATMREQEKDRAEKQAVLEELKDRKAERTKATLLNDIERIEATLDSLEEERGKVEAKLEAALVAEKDIQRAIDRVRQIKAELGEALNLADATFEDRRFLIERLNVDATLLVENGEKIVDARCYLGDERLKLSDYSNVTEM